MELNKKYCEDASIRLISVILILSSLGFCCKGQATQGKVTYVRDLTKYEEGGHYDLNWQLPDSARAQMRVEIRSFLWRHWKDQRQGHLSLTAYTYEGDDRKCEFFIEPDAEGKWRIVIQSKTKELNSGKNMYSEIIIDTVERFRIIDNRENVVDRIPSDEIVDAEFYRLRLSDSLHNEVKEEY